MVWDPGCAAIFDVGCDKYYSCFDCFRAFWRKSMSGSFTFLGESSFEWAVAVGIERDHRLRSQDPRDGSERSFFLFLSSSRIIWMDLRILRLSLFVGEM
jgi:hypothetical protein